MLRHHAALGSSSIVFMVLALVTSTSTAQELPLVLHPNGLNSVVTVAAREAYRRLGDPGCRQIFSEFRDGSGRLLQEQLDAIGQTGESYLGWIWFVDGGVAGRCERPEVVAFTSPGSQV